LVGVVAKERALTGEEVIRVVRIANEVKVGCRTARLSVT
jgi:hypothetical protein